MTAGKVKQGQLAQEAFDEGEYWVVQCIIEGLKKSVIWEQEASS